ncbi:aldo/keto reductase [Massilia sp. TSP1-1-2]|uniref:aldo/keto reductase n=1 Tax=Massilia sp. TSP1-1-2 TaxID=2804649 RepID=UPI003CF67D6E
MKQRILGHSGIAVSAVGLGCMGMSEFYGATDDAEALRVIGRALELGVSLFDTADTYGAGHNETLLARALGKDSGAVVATKFGIRRAPGVYERRIDNSAAYIRQACEDSLRRLKVDTIDLYYAHRLANEVPIEETVGAMAELVAEGKVRALGLCEVGPETLRRAHAVHPIAAVQSEYSLWTRDAESALLPACRELGIGFVAYSPLGRGMLTGAIDAGTVFAADDFRKIAPRFQNGNLDENVRLVAVVTALAAEKACTAGQVALAWLLAQEGVTPIPGTKRRGYLEQNVGALAVCLNATELQRLDRAMPLGAASGERYPAAGMQGLGN